MTQIDFFNLLENPQHINEVQTSSLKSVINKYPYFQSARAIYLKGLKNKDSFKYNQELKTTAAHTTDRSILFDFITSEVFLQNNISKQIQQTTELLKDFMVTDAEDISVNKSVIIDDALRKHIEETKGVLDPQLFETKKTNQNLKETSFIPSFNIDSNPIEILPEEQLELGKPLEFNKTETHSFGEWLKLTSFKPIIRNEQTESQKSTGSKSEKFELIDKFIQANPKIQPIKKETTFQGITKTQISSSNSLMTETLARIYLEQKNYGKALQSYKILSLKYPEKSGFFADQIKAVKKIQEQNKTK
jgi:hypothetical protein